MDFNWRYTDSMRRFARVSACTRYIGTQTFQAYCPVMLAYDVGQGLEVPTFSLNQLTSAVLRSNEVCSVVVPLTLESYTKLCAGTDTMIRYLFAGYSSSTRLRKSRSNKGETYYGAPGILLDKDFSPLMIATSKVRLDENNNIQIDDRIIHIHPNVFLHDTGFLEKAIAKKGIAFYLSTGLTDYSNNYKAKVVIDDCSQFIRKANIPRVGETSPKDFTNILKDNIDEVLSQIADDELR